MLIIYHIATFDNFLSQLLHHRSNYKFEGDPLILNIACIGLRSDILKTISAQTSWHDNIKKMNSLKLKGFKCKSITRNCML